YPVPASRPLPGSSVVHLLNVRQTIQGLQALRIPARVLAQREAIQVWAPLCDRIVELFQETVKGPAPTLGTGADGKPLRSPSGQVVIEGGWPCQHYPDGWQVRARATLEDYRRQRAEHHLCSKPERKGGNFALLRGYLETCLREPRQLTGRDVGMIRF